MRVAILPTGLMEWRALPKALGRLFPGHDFYGIPTLAEVESRTGLQFPAQSFTSCDVTRIAGRPSAADKLIERAVAEGLGDRSRKAADLVVVLDDLELANVAQPDAVVSIVREAVQRVVARQAGNTQRLERFRDTLRQRVSFHLARPMIEAWLFPDAAAMRLAGVPGDRLSKLERNPDPESFKTSDRAYVADDACDCRGWQALSEKRRKDHRPLWVRAAERRQIHPKAYLSWLCKAPDQQNCSTYSETGGGAQALAALDWHRLFSERSGAPFARALVDDVADALGEPSPFAGNLAAETARSKLPRDPVLRNL